MKETPCKETPMKETPCKETPMKETPCKETPMKKTPCKETPYTVLMPPPNLSGPLHMGHAMSLTISDIAVRERIMRNEPSLLIGGFDHGGITTEKQHVARFKQTGERRLRTDALRARGLEELNPIAYKIEKQVRKLKVEARCKGSARVGNFTPCWQFTMSDESVRTVQTAFRELKRRGDIYSKKHPSFPEENEHIFLKTDGMKEAAIEAITEGETKIRYMWDTNQDPEDIIRGIEDWCLTRKGWWGIDCHDTDDCVFSTWFGSCLWPLTLTHYFPGRTPGNGYPFDLLVTGHDIQMFWVFRMIGLCKYLTGVSPVKEVIFHGLILDKKGKMSKSSGTPTSPDTYIDRYGADAVRLALYEHALRGESFKLDERVFMKKSKFLTKVRNAEKLLKILFEKIITMGIKNMGTNYRPLSNV